jgi:hypothetical protein
MLVSSASLTPDNPSRCQSFALTRLCRASPNMEGCHMRGAGKILPDVEVDACPTADD